MGSLEGIVMAGVGDNDVRVGEGWDVGGLVDGLLKVIDALPRLGRDGENGGEGRNGRNGCDNIAACRAEVGLGVNGDEDSAMSVSGHGCSFCWCGKLIEKPEDDAGTVDGLISSLYADLLYLVGCLPDAGGVDEAKGDSLQVDCVFDCVAGGSMEVADDSTIFVE